MWRRRPIESGEPVLRMYEYERIRKVPYQMDFWLGEKDRFPELSDADRQ